MVEADHLGYGEAFDQGEAEILGMLDHLEAIEQGILGISEPQLAAYAESSVQDVETQLVRAARKTVTAKDEDVLG